jgi:hypothetical protein
MGIMGEHWYSFLLPVEESERQMPTRIYDVPLRRGLFEHAKAGNEFTISAIRNNFVVSERRRLSVESMSQPWAPFMAFRH